MVLTTRCTFPLITNGFEWRPRCRNANKRKSESAIFTVDPDHWPDGCVKGSGYRLVLSPYKGGKQVAVGDIDVYCRNGRRYYTGLGSEQIYVKQEMAVEKQSGEAVLVALRKTADGTEIVALQ